MATHRAFDDGRQTYIEFPPSISVGEAPRLFVIGATGEAQLVNYRVAGRFYVVDRLFDIAELRLGEKRQRSSGSCAAALIAGRIGGGVLIDELSQHLRPRPIPKRWFSAGERGGWFGLSAARSSRSRRSDRPRSSVPPRLLSSPQHSGSD